MNATCLHCHARFPGNDVVEAFPFARRVAYDPAKSRYWVVCHKCGKWSLAPLEDDDRALTIEYFERWWRGSPVHYTAGEIGVGRYSDKFTVVRVGPATWPEFASWRYADAIRRRRYVQNLRGGAAIAALAGFVGTGFMAPVPALAVAIGLPLSERYWPAYWLSDRKPVCRIPTSGSARGLVRSKHLMHMELEQTKAGWALNATHDAGAARLVGEEAIRALGYSLARINYRGASKRGVSDALSLIADAGGTDGMIERAVRPIVSGGRADPGLVARYPGPVRIALELAAREHAERRALENEIALLQHEWREAEEIAEIAGGLTSTWSGRQAFGPLGSKP